MYTLGAITFGSVPAISVDQLENVQIDHGLAHLKVNVAGFVDTEMITNLAQTPSFGFTSSDLKVLLDYCGMDGKTIDAAVPDSELITYWRKYAEGGIFESGSDLVPVLPATVRPWTFAGWPVPDSTTCCKIV